jgi:hypothetical protein
MNLVDWASKYAAGYAIPSEIVFAVGIAESGLQMPYARFEPDHVWLWDLEKAAAFRRLDSYDPRHIHAASDFHAPDGDDDTEWVGQRTAWGPFAMVGARLRQAGYAGPLVCHCTDPQLAAQWACRHIADLHRRYGSRHGWRGVVSAYRLGRPRRNSEGQYPNEDYLAAVARAGAERFL